MWQSTRKFAAAVVLVLVLCFGTGGQAAADQTIRLNVPIDVSNLLPEVTHVGVSCGIFEAEDDTFYYALGLQWRELPVTGGVFDETIVMDIGPKPDRNFATAAYYKCKLFLIRPVSADGGDDPDIEAPYVAEPTGDAGDWNKADGAEPFSQLVAGPLTPDIVQILQGGNQTLSGGE